MPDKKILIIIGILITVGALSFHTIGWRKPPKEVKGVSSQPMVEASTEEGIIPQGKFYAPILAYHHIAVRRPQNSYYVSPEIFEEQMQWLRKNDYQVISFDEFYEAAVGRSKIPPKPVVLTFDDGNVDHYTNAFPILKKYNYKGIFFIKINSIAKNGRGMTWNKLKEMADAGMTIGSHSINHNNMANMKETTLEYELSESKKILEKNLGVEIKYFAYPGGAYSPKTIEAVKNAGYLAAVTTKHKVDQEIKDDNSIYTLPRVHIDDEMPTFIDWIQGINLY